MTRWGVAVLVGAMLLAQGLDLDEVLFRASEAVVRYERQFSSVVAEERYLQRVVRPDGTVVRERTTRSDFLLVRPPGAETWLGFRDVIEVDGKPVADRQTRLEKLFLDAPEEAFDRARRIAAESARYNIGRIQRTINVPILSLLFLHVLNRHRFYFEKVGEEIVDGVPTWVVRYSEHARPTIVRAGGGDVFARGTFWIDPGSGHVVKSLLILGDGLTGVRSTITVTFKPDPRLGVWVPVEMQEVYDNPRDPRDEQIHATASYSNFRQFRVRTEERISRE
jgi:hypothetical protein